ncbi:hypothetical protein HHK36_023213 [Tetracentron sinense]|uniref:Cysteine-rich transmembrane domain-containing protein n=1 Tax=Tetracentron sinense TaxID=13715 RepID=A0A834YKW1_TETSI|nr:hypothetical protein HHK36_023213 [Tetracentron sinense]
MFLRVVRSRPRKPRLRSNPPRSQIIKVAYPPPPNSQPPLIEGYPMKDGYGHPQQAPPPGKTKRRGDGFWKGCCAALCCCCVLDMCF